MNVKELRDKLAEYPDSMSVVVFDIWAAPKGTITMPIIAITEDHEVPNTVIIKI